MARPCATYRLQFNGGFDFKAAAGLINYLRELKISDIYVSPIFQAVRGSSHGYDVVDHNKLNPELGSEADFEQLTAACKEAGLGWVQDIVPNHCAFDSDNFRLMDILENGVNSEFYNFFDIVWEHPYPTIRGRLLAPFLGTFYAESLEQGQIKLNYGQRGFTIDYYQLSLPLKIESYTMVLTHGLSKLKTALGEAHSDYLKLLGVIYILKNLPLADQRKERLQQIMFVKKMLWELYTNCPEFKNFIQSNIQTFNGVERQAETYNLLDRLLSEQVFRLAFWKVGTEEINYRRFFSINSLICLRVENQEVFDVVHELVFRLVKEQKITGFRIDHIDGLWDPAKYLERLNYKAGTIYTVVEKILALHEQLPPSWPVQGTTGYDFLNYANGLFCDRRNENKFDRIYTAFTGERMPYTSLKQEKKRLIIRTYMTADIDNMALFIKQISNQDRYGKDITLHGLRRGLVEVLTMFPIYRTYISYQNNAPTDQAMIAQAINDARYENHELLHEFDFIERFLLLKFSDVLSQQDRSEWVRFVMRFQQFSSPLMAKGVEDTLLYVYNRLISLNEIGSDPARFGISVKQFHAFNQYRVKHWPATMNATSTHDAKRGEDVRARIDVLSELPQSWLKAVRLWRDLNRPCKPTIDGIRVPDPNDEYFLYQTLIGVYPFDPESDFTARLKRYITKAVREAKTHTEWLKPDTAYEDGFTSFIDAILVPSGENKFLSEFLEFQRMIAWYGVFNSLSQVLLKIVSPGVPDFYQGSELWDLSMVDPDNRRPVDFERRKTLLEKIKTRIDEDLPALMLDMLAEISGPSIKMFTILHAMNVRDTMKDVLEEGDYVPLRAVGPYAMNVIAFARIKNKRWVIAIAPRFLTRVVHYGQLPLGTLWRNTQIEIRRNSFPPTFTDAFTGRTLASAKRMNISEILADFPLGLLTGAVD
jgi:(1->4)-alpha-D-glucan 1-alpha-D-glucosylmutase